MPFSYFAFPPLAADEANVLMDWKEPDASERSLQELLRFFVAISKQKRLAHVILATSDFFLVAWLLGSELLTFPRSRFRYKLLLCLI